ncbi:helix-turn-helix domain-containing protein [Microbacterium sp. AZCO]|uniref:TetR/AcrR family transcriptional regulator n=1 Tax=Microbacterium sp. AZCO TaxID=3142976 RepID=UPI0031F432D6
MRRGANARGRRTIAAIERAALDAAEALPWERVTVAEICRRAGVSERVFFNHFPTREDAFLGVDQPTVDEEEAERYVADADIPLLTGAARLVRLPQVDEEMRRRRSALTAAHGELLARAYGALVPVRERCRAIVADAIGTRDPAFRPEERRILAAVIVGAASELLDPAANIATARVALLRLRNQLH